MNINQILADLIAFDTSVPPGNNYEAALRYLAPLFETVGMQTQLIPIPPDQAEGRTGRFNLVCHKPDPCKMRLIFYAHIDVVPASGWTAFKAEIKDGRIYGRGAADMKGSIPALLSALERVKDQKINYDLTVLITTDEELSQASQLRYIQKYIQPTKGAYFFDLDSNFGYLATANLGALQIEIKVKGKSVHSGLSHLGINAVEQTVPVLQALLQLKQKVAARESKIKTHPESGLKNMVARLNINMIQGGLKVNIVPDQCIISVDRRLIPEEDLDTAREEIINTLRGVNGVDWEISSETTIASLASADDPLTDKLASILKEVIGEGGKYGEMGSGDLGNMVVKEWGGKIFGLGVIRSESNMHGVNEFVYIKDIEDLSEVIRRFLVA
jgi:succinyl-diaminopimelate desuccinylase